MRRLIASVLVAGAAAGIWLAASGESGPATHIATCPVRVDDSCLALAADAGLALRRYDRARIPVIREVDGGAVSFVLPAGLRRAGRCLEVTDWSDCTIEPASARPAVAARWGNALPLSLAGVVRKCRRAPLDGGVCTSLDGGPLDSPGQSCGRNVYHAAMVMGASCEPVECVTEGECSEEVL